jgi:hypothetical protein
LTISPILRGSGIISIKAIDPYNEFAEAQFTITIENQPVDKKDEMPGVTGDLSEPKLQINLGDYFADADGDNIVYAIVVADGTIAEGIVVNGILKIEALKVGSTDVTVNATDNFGLTITSSFELTVSNVTGVEGSEKLSTLTVAPNPAKESVVITYHVVKRGKVSLKLIDNQGKVVSDIVNEEQEPGMKGMSFCPAMKLHGLYFVRYLSGNNSQVSKVVFE